MDIAALRSFFLWCTIINGALLIWWYLVTAFAQGWLYRLHSRWFQMPRETFTMVLYCFIGVMKVLVIVFNLVPFIALAIIG